VSNEAGKTVRLEGPQNLFVLFRAEAKRVGKIRVASEDCELDAGGLRFVWLTGVKPAESVALLSSYATAGDGDEDAENDLAQGAMMAVALHGDASADRALESFVAKERPESLRKHSTFWLGEARGKAGFAILKRMAQNDPSEEVREQVTFALSVSREPEALDEMIRMAKNDSSEDVRGQALFWLAQKAGKKATGTISEAIENDPNTEVKKKAVFALSQLPREEGVPKLIEVARTNKNAAVRKQAIFWLGQSNDPRALKFFEEILTP
jgi:HEAT repeat protein